MQNNLTSFSLGRKKSAEVCSKMKNASMTDCNYVVLCKAFKVILISLYIDIDTSCSYYFKLNSKLCCLNQK